MSERKNRRNRHVEVQVLVGTLLFAGGVAFELGWGWAAALLGALLIIEPAVESIWARISAKGDRV